MKIRKYKNVQTWTKAMRADKEKKLWFDWFNIGGNWYVCEEYDESGKYMRYTSLTALNHIDIETSNRYSDKWLSDMVAIVYPIEDLRFDISYYLQTEDLDRKTIMLLNIWLWDNKMYKAMKDLIDLLANNLK
jgi:hypothetical protein